jgi:hypothetical protein
LLEDEIHGRAVHGGDLGEEPPHLGRSSTGNRFSRSNVNATSREVKGAPSDQDTPSRRVNLSRVLSSLQS